MADVAAARVDHPAATGINHLETTAVVDDPTVSGLFFFFAFTFVAIVFFMGHGKTSNEFPPTRPKHRR
ncbi:hypothetical protein JCM12296A_16000 [Desulfosarcina cetonica]